MANQKGKDTVVCKWSVVFGDFKKAVEFWTVWRFLGSFWAVLVEIHGPF